MCYSNNLTSLDVRTNTALTYLSCGSNNLNSLDVSANTDLTYLEVQENNLTSLDLTSLTNTDMSDTNFNATGNADLNCIVVNNVTYSTSNWFNIDAGTTFTTDCNYNLAVEKLVTEDYNLFPNPVQDILHIKSKVFIDNIILLDVHCLEKLRSTKKEINLQYLAPGVYILKIISGKKVINKKIIKL